MTRHDVVCAVDVGTSAVRVALVTSAGRRVRQHRRERPAGSGATFDAKRLWHDFCQVLSELTDDLGTLRVRSLAIAGHVGTVLVDESLDPVGEPGGWADTRGADMLAHGWDAPAAALYRAGRPAVSGGAVPLLCWLRAKQPRLLERIRWVLSPKDFLNLRLTGTAATDWTCAAYTLGSDIRQRAWANELLTPTGLSPACFPVQHAAANQIGTVSAIAAAQAGVPEGTPVVAGGPDGTVGAAAMIGSQPEAVADVAGTTDVITRVITSPAHAPSGALVNPFITEGLWSCGGPTGATGGAVAYWCRMLGLGSPAEAERRLSSQLAALPPGCDGLQLSPLLNGSRFPGWNPAETAAVWGLTERHTPAHIVRAAQEATAFVVREALEIVAPTEPAIPLMLAGGAARSPHNAQLRADILDRPVLTSSEADVSLQGAALLALVGSGLQPDLRTAQAAVAPRHREYLPDRERTNHYTYLFQIWRSRRQAALGGLQQQLTESAPHRAE